MFVQMGKRQTLYVGSEISFGKQLANKQGLLTQLPVVCQSWPDICLIAISVLDLVCDSVSSY